MESSEVCVQVEAVTHMRDVSPGGRSSGRNDLGASDSGAAAAWSVERPGSLAAAGWEAQSERCQLCSSGNRRDSAAERATVLNLSMGTVSGSLTTQDELPWVIRESQSSKPGSKSGV